MRNSLTTKSRADLMYDYLEGTYTDMFVEAIERAGVDENARGFAALVTVEMLKLGEERKRSLKSIIAAMTVKAAVEKLWKTHPALLGNTYDDPSEGLRAFLKLAELKVWDITKLLHLGAIAAYLHKYGVPMTPYIGPETFHKVLEVAHKVRAQIDNDATLNSVIAMLEDISMLPSRDAAIAKYVTPDIPKDSSSVAYLANGKVVITIFTDRDREIRYERALSKLAYWDDIELEEDDGIAG